MKVYSKIKVDLCSVYDLCLCILQWKKHVIISNIVEEPLWPLPSGPLVAGAFNAHLLRDASVHTDSRMTNQAHDCD